MTEYASPFDLKAEKKKVDAQAKEIQDPKVKKAFIARANKELDEHAQMLRKMSAFVNAKNKNGQHPSGLR
jgi:hypothetical protein